MIIKSLDKMEEIVKGNRFLSWDGWTVVHSSLSETAWMSKNGRFVKGKWYVQKRYEPRGIGWEIPDKFVR